MEFRGRSDPETDAPFERVRDEDAFAPRLSRLELGNVLLQANGEAGSPRPEPLINSAIPPPNTLGSVDAALEAVRPSSSKRVQSEFSDPPQAAFLVVNR